MKVALLHPNDDIRYSNLSLGYGKGIKPQRPPETWAAILDSYQGQYSIKGHH